MRIIIPVAILAISVVGYVLLKNGSLKASAPADSATEEATQPKETAWDVHVETLRLQNLAPQIILHGRFETPRETLLSAAINADIREVKVLDGSRVKKDDTLVRLDDTDAKLTLAQRAADLAEVVALMRAETRAHQANQDAIKRERQMLALAARTQERLAKLAKSQVGSERVLDDARVQVQSSHLAINSRQERIDSYDARMAQLSAREQRANASIDAAQRDIDRSIVRAPFNGRVTSVSVSPGERVRAGDPLLSVYDVDFVELRVQVPERYLGQLRASQKAGEIVRASSELDGHQLELRFDRFAGKIERGRGGVDALFRLEASDIAPDIGRTVSTVVDLPTANRVFAVPMAAMYGSNTVYKVNDANRLSAVSVTRIGNLVDSNNNTKLLVTSDTLKEGARLVVSQVPRAIDGLLVNPVDKGAL